MTRGPGSWKSRRRLVALSLAVPAVLLIGALAWLARPASPLKADRFPEIRPGMTRAEAERLLGGPPGDYGTAADGEVEVGDGSVVQAFAVPSATPPRVANWRDDRHNLFLFFDAEDRVVAASRSATYRRSFPLPRRLLRALLRPR